MVNDQCLLCLTDQPQQNGPHLACVNQTFWLQFSQNHPANLEPLSLSVPLSLPQSALALLPLGQSQLVSGGQNPHLHNEPKLSRGVEGWAEA